MRLNNSRQYMIIAGVAALAMPAIMSSACTGNTGNQQTAGEGKEIMQTKGGKAEADNGHRGVEYEVDFSSGAEVELSNGSELHLTEDAKPMQPRQQGNRQQGGNRRHN